MENKFVVYVIAGIAILLLVGSIIVDSGMLNGNTIKNSESQQTNPGLEKYRSENIPEECRLSEYEDNVESWKQHLSHHKETHYCLEYFNEEVKGGIR